jgi:Uncharacterised nucleotidyltransferase
LNRSLDSLVALGAPRHIVAALELLQIHGSSGDLLSLLTEVERRRFSEWCDVRQLTLILPNVSGQRLPPWAAEPILEKACRYELRFQRLKRELFEIVGALDNAGLEFVMLKGLSHAPALSPEARLRAQGDIDLWLRGSSVYKARDVLSSLGYVPLLESRSRHLAPMGRPSHWRWRGDLFDPEMPVSVELHHELWSEQVEYIAAPDLQQFWDRKKLRDFDGHNIHVLCHEDLLGFAALHLLLHLLHGELPLQRAWEIARFLDNHVNAESFWRSWRSLHSPALRELETPVFYLVSDWFHCRSNPSLAADFQRLPRMVKRWLERYPLAPLTREWTPNKSEVWLHLALITDRRRKLNVLLRRLVPISLPTFGDRAEVRQTRTGKLLKMFRQLGLIRARLVHHVITFIPTLCDGVRWFWVR